MKKNKSIFAPIISGIYKKISCMKTGTIKNNNKLQVTKSEFVNDYLTVEEQEMFEKRAIPMGVWWRGKGAILGCDLPNKVICTVDRENHVYLFDLGIYHDALDLDMYNFELVWDDVLGNIGVTFTMKYEYTSERIIGGVGRNIIWKDFKLNMPYEFHSKRELVIVKIKEAMQTYGTTGRPEAPIPKYKIEFDF
ncbi:hypothetical protein GCWU000282_00093 [Catonella morbi ATCC 51271]|uniref:Uncharacterized protein n=1 Tax=Catonella morbi ATCC 51271 TaxID=592026 RepID=V2YAM3_9FIRM|nr:hypothetical protein [Catonella morbi]ESL04706.1 hypothetical protein GCWU000282_00093 [Catonella morbi ATCC 51271]